MKSAVPLALFTYGVSFADDVYLHTGFVFRNVKAVDTVGTDIRIQRDGNLFNIRTSVVARIEIRPVDPSVKSSYELYSQELYSQYRSKTSGNNTARTDQLNVVEQAAQVRPTPDQPSSVDNESFITGSLGYNFYSPPEGSRLEQYPERFSSYGGVAASFRILLKTPGIWSRLSLGFEYSLHSLASEKSSEWRYVESNEPVTDYINAQLA